MQLINIFQTHHHLYLSLKSRFWGSPVHTDFVLWNENEEDSVTETDAKERDVC